MMSTPTFSAAAFESFLKSFKSSSASEATTRNALQGLHIEDDDGGSDEYDFMEDVDGGDGNAARPARQHRRDPKLKYMEVLQGVADRAVSEVLIDLDDLESVRRSY
jgi:DNA replication licensing factor MCM7